MSNANHTNYPSNNAGGGGGPSGRSPYPPGSAAAAARRSSVGRPSFDQEGHSPFLNNLLRFSPKNSSHISPLNNFRRDSVTNAGQRHKPRFFHESTTTAASAAADAAASASTSKNQAPLSSDNNNESTASTSLEDSTPEQQRQQQQPTKAPALMDGIPIDRLRAMSKETLLTTPSTAAFYSGLLFAKTNLPADALLLAQAHVSAGQYEACLRILEETALLQQPSHTWDAVLVASQALAAKRDWTSLIEVLEDICRFPSTAADSPAITSSQGGQGGGGATTNTFHALAVSQPLEDGDSIGWLNLKRAIPNDPNPNIGPSLSSSSGSSIHYHRLHPLSLICWYRGLAYHETGCGLRAGTFWKFALKMDCRCQQAWESLLEKNLVSPGEAHRLLTEEVEFGDHEDWLRSLYLARIELTPQEPVKARTDDDPAGKKNNSSAFLSSAVSMALHGTSLDASSIEFSSPLPAFQTPGASMNETMDETDDDNNKKGTNADKASQIQRDVDSAFDDLWNKYKLHDSPQVLAMAARRAYRQYDWKTALLFCEDLAQLDPTVEEAAFCYISTLVALGHHRVLFRLAHEWVDASPKSAKAWFAVGAYYYAIQRYHVAQRHFCRATRLDPQCTEAWIAFGCSFAACDESDQALASFRAAQRLSPGEHTSLMYMGMEYVRTNHLVLAQYFLQAALTSSGGDPLCLHELGVLAFQKGDHEEAIHWFYRALASAVGTDEDSIDLCHDPYWEPTIFNLGHSYRKCQRYESAVACFRRCIALCPEKFSAYTALAFTKQLMRHTDEAIVILHQALSLKPDDPFSTDLLNRALEDQMASGHQKIFDLPTSAAAPASVDHSGASLLVSPWSKNEDSRMSEDMESDADMTASS